MDKRYVSAADWPKGTCRTATPDHSEDGHDSMDAALAVCRRLAEEGFGGDRKVFPLKTWVRVLYPTGDAVEFPVSERRTTVPRLTRQQLAAMGANFLKLGDGQEQASLGRQGVWKAIADDPNVFEPGSYNPLKPRGWPAENQRVEAVRLAASKVMGRWRDVQVAARNRPVVNDVFAAPGNEKEKLALVASLNELTEVISTQDGWTATNHTVEEAT